MSRRSTVRYVSGELGHTKSAVLSFFCVAHSKEERRHKTYSSSPAPLLLLASLFTFEDASDVSHTHTHTLLP
jgi:hypothetical protein